MKLYFEISGYPSFEGNSSFQLQVHLLTWWRQFPSIFFQLHNYPQFNAIKYIPRVHKTRAPCRHGDRILYACTSCLSALVRNVIRVTILVPIVFRLIPDFRSGLGCHSRYRDSLRSGRSGDRIPAGGEIFHTRSDRPWSPLSLLYKSAEAWRWPFAPHLVQG